MAASPQRSASRRRARRAQRRPDGRFVRTYDRLTLYQIARDVATVAARRHKKTPETLTIAEWNAHRKYLRHRWGRIPRAHEICRQLADAHGRPLPWDSLRRVVSDPSIDLTMFDAAQRSVPDRPISQQRARNALQRVARSRGKATLTPQGYEDGRHELLTIAADRSPIEQQALEDILPTLSQILWLHGQDWDAALADAGLEPRPVPTPPKRSHPPHTELELLNWIDGYLGWLDGRASSDNMWRRFARVHSGAPAVGAFKLRGGLAFYLAESRRKDRAKRAAKRDHEARVRAAEAKARGGRTRASRPGPRGQNVLELLRESGPLGTRELATICGIHRETVRLTLNRLIAFGLVEPVQTRRNAQDQRYRAT